MKDQVMEAIDAIEQLYERRGGITGISTGFAELDRMTNGLHESEMIVIAARPSMGKTALAMNIAEHVAINEKLPVAVFSLEMSSQQLVQRLLCSRARVNLQKVRDGFLAERDFPSLTAAASKLAEAQIFIDDSASLSILEMPAKARRLKAQKDIKLIVVDYLQLLRSDRKSTRLNSSHLGISYAVFCLKKKKTSEKIESMQHNTNTNEQSTRDVGETMKCGEPRYGTP